MKFLSLLGLMVFLLENVTAAPPVQARPADSPPLPHAVRVISLASDQSPGQAAIAPDSIGSVIQPWLSDHEVLHFYHGLLYRYDLTTKTDTPLMKLTRQVKTSPCSLYFLSVSPHGRQVIWGISANNPLFVADVKGTRREQWDGDNGMTEPVWCADGKQWIQFHFGGTPTHLHWTGIQVHRWDQSNVSENILSIPPGLNGLDILAAMSPDEIVARIPDQVTFVHSSPGHSVKHPDGSETFVIEQESKTTTRRTQIISVWSLHRPQPVHRWAIYLPGQAQEVSVSPDGKRVAWLLTPTVSVHHAARAFAFLSLWVSQLDGRHMHKIGLIAIRGKENHPETMAFPMELCWVPGNKKISFCYGNALWAVPVD